MAGRTILVTGGAGFMGSHFVRHRLERHPADTVVVLDALTYAGRLDRLPSEALGTDRLQFVHGNVRSTQVVESLVERCDVVVHFAAETHVPRSISDGAIFMETDVLGTQAMTAAAVRRAGRLERFVHVSTSEVYGTAVQPAMDETHPLVPRTPYAAAKCGADRLVHACALTHGLPAVIVRPFNNYGPGQHLEKLVPRLIASALLGEPLVVHGDGTPSRDWLHVSDTAQAIDLVVDAPLEAVREQVFNLGTGVATDVLSLARKVAELTGRDADSVAHSPDRPGQVDRQCCDAGKAAAKLGFRPQTALADGLAETVAWYRDNRSWWEPMRWMRSVPVMGEDGRVTWW